MGQNNQHARRVPRSEKRAAIVFPTGLSRTRFFSKHKPGYFQKSGIAVAIKH